MPHTKPFRKNLVRQLVGRIRKKNARKRGRNSIAEGSERLHERQFTKKSQMVKQKIVQCAATGK